MKMTMAGNHLNLEVAPYAMTVYNESASSKLVPRKSPHNNIYWASLTEK